MFHASVTWAINGLCVYAHSLCDKPRPFPTDQPSAREMIVFVCVNGRIAWERAGGKVRRQFPDMTSSNGDDRSLGGGVCKSSLPPSRRRCLSTASAAARRRECDVRHRLQAALSDGLCLADWLARHGHVRSDSRRLVKTATD